MPFSLALIKWPAKLLVIRGMLVIAGGFIVHLSLGSFYTFANIAPYISSYIRNQSHPSDLPQTATTWIYTCAIAGMGCTAWFGGWLTQKLGPRLTTLIGGVIMSAGVLLTYWAIKVSFWLVLVTYGLMFGVGMGVAYTAPLSAAMQWMPRWRGAASGFVVSGFGLGALAFTPLQTHYVNPLDIPPTPDPFDDNLKQFTDPELLQRIPMMFVILGATFAAMQLIGVILIANPPAGYLTEHGASNDKEDITVDSDKIREVNDVQLMPCCERKNTMSVFFDGNTRQSASDEETILTKSPRSQSPVFIEQSSTSETTILSDCENESLLYNDQRITYGSEESNDLNKKVEELPDNGFSIVSLSPLQVLKRRNFYILWFMLLCNGTAVLFVSSNLKFFGNSFIHSDHFIATVGSVSSIFNCLGRIGWGVFADYFSYRCAIILLSATMAAFTLTFYSSVVGGEAMFFIWVCAIFFCIGGNYSVFPTAVAKAYGLKYVATNFGLLYSSTIIAGVLAATVSSSLVSHIGYSGLLFIVGGFNCVGFLSSLFFSAKLYIAKL